MDLTRRLDLELKSYRRISRALDRLREKLEWPEGTPEFQELIEVLSINAERIEFLKARLAAGQT